MPKILCTNKDHKDSRPSMEVYQDHGFCFVCNHYDPDVGDATVIRKEPEDIRVTIQTILGLQSKLVRGLELPFDDQGYYILWPDHAYYKRRNWHDSPRYKCPKGIKQPLLSLLSKSKQLVIIEGELNALSLKKALPKLSICSPGAASQLKSFLLNYLTISDRFTIVIDRDAAGVAAGVWLKRELNKRGKRASLIACEKDVNQLLQETGGKGVQDWAGEAGLEV